MLLVAIATLSSCEKVSPIGVLMAGTGVEDRVKMSNLYYQKHQLDYKDQWIDSVDYTFLIGADSHITNDTCRLAEMLQIGLDNNDLFYAHLGDIADTKAEYYINLDNTLQQFKRKYANKYFHEIPLDELSTRDNEGLYCTKSGDTLRYEDIDYPFYPVVGNHDLTHNGWPLWCNIFHSSFYEFNIILGNTQQYDHFIFLDTASGTLGEEQVRLIEEGILDAKDIGSYMGFKCRYTFVFSHTNIFRPSSLQFSSTFAREETFYLLSQFEEWNVTAVFCGHVHAWDERDFAGVHYVTLDSMSERNSPSPGKYLLRVHLKKNGEIEYERVQMNYVKK